VATGRPSVSDGIIGRGRGSAVVVLAAPVALASGGRGILAVPLPTGKLAESLQAQIGTGTTTVLLVDSAGQALVSSDPQQATELAVLRGRPEVEAVLAGETGSQVVGLAARDTLVAYAPVGPYGWGVLLAEPTASAFAWAQRSLVERLALLGLVILLVGWIGWYLGGRLARYYQEAVEARALAEEAVHTRDQVLASAAHDLRNPLTAIRGHAQLLWRQATRGEAVAPERLTQVAAQIDRSTRQMATLIDELLDLARLQIGQSLELDRRPTDLVALTARIVADHQDTSSAHAVRLESVAPRLVGAWDGPHLERVVGNLVANAIKYSPDGGIVRVRVRETDVAGARWAELAVQDEGLGIPRDELSHVFERFYRGRQVAGRIGGSGIGLAATREIVEQHGGTIAVESTEGKGTTVTVRLPLGDEAPADPRS
jgi:signal transduction histidine kinase